MHFPAQELHPESLTFQSWLPASKFVYKDSLGQEYHYESSTLININRDEMVTVPCNKGSGVIYFKSPFLLRGFIDASNTSIYYVHSVTFSETEDVFIESNFVDLLGVSVYNDNLNSAKPLSDINLITSVKESTIDLEEYNLIFSNIYDSLTILSKTFYDVYEQKSGTPKLYYTKVQGVVAFTDIFGNRLVLERIE
ncbi:MAG TPA: hypothetical protein VI603_09505 [Saprospiraceae bacterium]|nr:hypothetical protein [Saprospiraceae bacterium]